MLSGAALAGCSKDDCLSGSTRCGGTCVVLGEDNLNCGACGSACAASRVCSAGACAFSCQAGLSNCSGSCRDLQADHANCGGCGSACAAGRVCSAGTCALSCQAGLTDCSGSCRDLQADRANCGGCGAVCSAGETCSAGTCALSCQAGLTKCSGSCRDLQFDRDNCGACGAACAAGQTCSSGACSERTWQVLASTPAGSCPGLSDFIPAGQTSVYALEERAFAVYDPGSDAWAALAQPPIYMGCWPGTAWMGDQIYTIKGGGVYSHSISSGVWTANVAGGLQDTWYGQSTGDDSGFVYAMTSDGTGTILQYDTATGAVNTFAGPTDVAGEPRAAWDSLTKLVYLGDFSNPLFYAFDPATGAVASLAPSPEPGDAFCSDRRGHVFHTGSICRGSRTVWAYTAGAGTWTRLPDLPFDTGCNAACTVSSDGWLYFADDGNFARIALF